MARRRLTRGSGKMGRGGVIDGTRMKLLYLRINTGPGSFEDKPRKKKPATELTYLEHAIHGAQYCLELPGKGLVLAQDLAHKTSEAVWSLFMGRGRK